MTWYQAKEFCNNLGGYLVNIEAEAEELLLEEQLDPAKIYWIGLNDQRVEGQFEWTETPEVTYTKWDRYQEERRK